MTPETFDAIIDAIEQGETLKRAIANAKTSWRALQLHIFRDDDAASRYARARTVSAQFYADKAQEAVEQARTGEEATIARVRADVYRWRARVANPREYGDKVEVEQTGTIQHLHLAALQAANAQRINALPPVTARIALPDTAIPRIGDGPPSSEDGGGSGIGAPSVSEPPMNVVPEGDRVNGMGKLVHAVGAESRVRALASDGGEEEVEGGIGEDGGEEPPFEVVEDGE